MTKPFLLKYEIFKWVSYFVLISIRLNFLELFKSRLFATHAYHNLITTSIQCNKLRKSFLCYQTKRQLRNCISCTLLFCIGFKINFNVNFRCVFVTKKYFLFSYHLQMRLKPTIPLQQKVCIITTTLTNL